MKSKSNALKKKVEYRGDLKVTHKGNEHTYEPSEAQAKKNRERDVIKRKTFGTNY